MTQNESRAPRAFYFFDNSLVHDHYIDQCTVQKISPGFGDIIFTNRTTYFAYLKRFEMLHGSVLDTTNHSTDTALENYFDVIHTARKNHWRFKIIVRASDPMLCDYTNEGVMPSWTKARLTIIEDGYKVKIWFSKYQPHWCHSRKFTLNQGGFHPQSIDFMKAFCLCLEEWKSLMVISKINMELTIRDRSPRCTTKFGKVFEIPRNTLRFPDYMWAFIWFLPTKMIENIQMFLSDDQSIVYRYTSSPDAYVMLEDTDGLKLSFSTFDYRMQQTRERFFHETIVDFYMALAPFQIAVYEFFEIIKTLPYMQNATRQLVVRVLESLFRSVQKVYKKREEKPTHSSETKLK